MIIEVTGIDGAGKSTLTQWIASTWGFGSRKVQPFDELFWRDTAYIEHSLGTRAVEVVKAGAIARALLVEASRINDEHIVFDRYLESACMYWAVKDIFPVPPAVLSKLRKPNHVVFLDIDPEDAILRRIHPSERTLDEELTYLRRCAAFLRSRAAQYGWMIVDASLPLENVKAEIHRLLTGALEA